MSFGYAKNKNSKNNFLIDIKNRDILSIFFTNKAFFSQDLCFFRYMFDQQVPFTIQKVYLEWNREILLYEMETLTSGQHGKFV